MSCGSLVSICWLPGYEDLNDAVRVSADPTFRLIGSPKLWDRGAALTSTLHWFETELLTQEENLVGLRAVNREVLAQAEMADARRPGRARHGLERKSGAMRRRIGSAYNGHFESVCHQPRILFTEHRGLGVQQPCGSAMCIAPRTGTICSCRKLTGSDLRASVSRIRANISTFAKPEIYDALEKRDVDYVIRMPANKSLELEIEAILFRPPGRPSCKPLVRYKSFRYQAKSWTTPRRIVAKVEHHRGELFPRVGFIVTNMVLPSRSVVRFYNKRGTAEQWIKEGKQATH